MRKKTGDNRLHHIYSRYFLQFFLPALLCITAGQLAAREAGKVITYEEYLKAVTDSLPEIRKNRLQVEKAQNTLDGSYSKGDVNLVGSGTYSSSDEYNTNMYSDTRRVTEYSFSAGVSKKFTGSGTTLEAGAGHDTITTEGYGTRYYPSVYIKFSQSVLKNTFGVIDRYAEKNAEMKLEIEKIRQAQSDRDALNYYKKLYFTWIELVERIELMRKSINYATEIQSDTEKKYKSGLAGIEDIYSARAIVSQYGIRYESLISELSEVEAEIRVLLNGDDIAPAHGEFEKMYAMSIESEFNDIPFVNTCNAEIYRLTKNSLAYTLDVNRNLLLPQLDIVGQYTRKSANEDFSGAYSSLDETEYYIGFTVSYPLWNTEADSTVREAELAVDEINAEYAITENAYRTNTGKLAASRQSLKKIIELSELRLKSLEAKYKTVYTKYRQGNLQLQQVIDALQDITDEKISLLLYKSSLIQNYIDYIDLTR